MFTKMRAQRKSLAALVTLGALTVGLLFSSPTVVTPLVPGTAAALAAGDANHPNAGECPVTAQESPGFAQLPDCRRYELVTPPQKNGALVASLFLHDLLPQVAAAGSRVIAPSVQCFAGAESCVAAHGTEGEPYEFERTAGGWVTHPLAPAAVTLETDSWWSVNPNTGTVLFSIPKLETEEDVFYARQGATLLPIGPVGEPGQHAEVDTLTTAGVLATADLSHVVYETTRPVWDKDPSLATSVYEYSATDLQSPLMVGVTGGAGSTALASICGTWLGNQTQGRKADGSLSEDGRTVYFAAKGRDNAECKEHSTAATAPPAYELYARIDGELPDAHTVLISGPTASTCTSEECKENTNTEKAEERARDAEFEGASSDGSHVFFTDTQQLTNGASEDPEPSESAFTTLCSHISGPDGCNLYESECVQPCAQPADERRLIDISEGAKATGGPRVQGVVAISADGSHVYFVAKSILTATPNARGEAAQEEADNLYLYTEGHVTFIATLSATDEEDWNPEQLKANVAPNGRVLVFLSDRPLTADDTRKEGEEAAQVFEYNAQTERLIRISVGEDGFDGDGNEEIGNASIVTPQDSLNSKTVPVPADPTMSDDGTYVFFTSPIGLTPHALKDASMGRPGFAQNVYEYHEGQVFLISDGKDVTEKTHESEAVELIGSDRSGANVFFTSDDPLVPQVPEPERDIYDAHECSEAEPCAQPAPASAPACEGEACLGTSSLPPVFGVPASETFSGPGNVVPGPAVKPKPLTRAQKLAKALKVCHVKHNKRKRLACEKQARKKYGRKSSSQRRHK